MIYNTNMKIAHLLENEHAAAIFDRFLPGMRKMAEGNPQASALSVEQLVHRGVCVAARRVAGWQAHAALAGCFANNYFTPAPIRDIHLRIPGLTGKEKPRTLRGGRAELRASDGSYEIKLDELKDYEAIILE